MLILIGKSLHNSHLCDSLINLQRFKWIINPSQILRNRFLLFMLGYLIPLPLNISEKSNLFFHFLLKKHDKNGYLMLELHNHLKLWTFQAFSLCKYKAYSHKYLLNSYLVPDTVLDIVNTMLTIKIISLFYGAFILVGTLNIV